MAATEMPKIIFIQLDGSDTRFQIRLNNRIAQTATLRLGEYSTAGATDRFVTLQFVNMRGFQLNPISSNVAEPDSFVILTPTPITTAVYSPGKLIGTMSGGEMREFEILVKDPTGVPHNPSSNKLFDYLHLSFVVQETPVPRAPLFLQGVPTVQQTFDSA